MTRAVRIDWRHVVERAAEIVWSYDTSVTLRQLFYRLVSAQEISNTESAYKRLSSVTAQARRDGTFPSLIDRGREIHRRACWDSPADAVAAVHDQYRLDRTAGQERSVYLGVEKAGLVVQLEAWFGHLGVPVLALGGYASETYAQDILGDVGRAGRPAVLLYAGDFDPSGEDIDRDFVERTDCWAKVVRVALDAEQVRAHELPVNPGKATDSRAAGFLARHGELVQVELDALPPETLHSLYEAALSKYWDTSTFDQVLDQERIDRAQIQEALDSLNEEDQ